MGTYEGPRNPHPASNEAAIVIYGYIPSLGVGAAGVALFLLLLAGHIVLLIRCRGTRTFQGLLAFGCAMEVVGYGFRLASHYHPFVVNSFIIQYFTIVCAPICFSAALYLALAAILRHTNSPRDYSPISPRALVTVFVIADVLTIGAQVAGASLTGISESKNARGEHPPIAPDDANHILLAGLAIQSGAFLIFLAILGCVILRLGWPTSTLVPDSKESYNSLISPTRPPIILLAVLASSSLLIFLRTIFRLAETAEGVFGEISSQEGYFAGLEFIPVVLALALWAAFPLGRGLRFMEERRGADRAV